MILIPCDKFNIETNKTKREVYSLLDIAVESRNINFFKIAMGKESTFIGNVSFDKFKIAHTSRLHNFFYPIIKGEYIETKKGTAIKMSSHPPLAAVFCYLAIFIAAIWILNFELLLFAALFLGLYLSVLIPYKYQTSKSKREIKSLLGDDF